ncbi:Rrf2 family transcriptional regulator [Synechococcus elongatus]|uniref:Transcriptional regulator, BadM/Rrf2 family n=3 Tax=Synechococcus elongatus TaxID=32046 RepID=Q31K04_SYNE7|nr:transcriptional regulator, BadM/Rrf2 family [Synechococcus elongatus PCC 7942 = FACHB-805]UOW72413.1 transcriptional regulator, BadM/Rrf2 family [Synechococcus elongatus PCC 7943]UOW75134.1 transcriptional regulator, BadM/Rrf2 family [Synechococcus elongatus PCC 6311]UOW77854.1 transcriptional regulator, BadM/Rrf2 family [Synechococcus elongatus PCC 6301]BAD79715.1 hypothetical protein syc1525_d [Synechococcus elongatus PCC 6301]
MLLEQTSNFSIRMVSVNGHESAAKEMKLTVRAHYSLKALIDLCLQPEDEPVSMRAIAQRQNISPTLLEKLLVELCKAGLVTATKGRRGGYQLARPAAKISLADILAAVGELSDRDRQPLAPEEAADWVSRAIWQRLDAQWQATLRQVSLADLYYDARSWQAAQGNEIEIVI